jgi:Xaa-Pro aminopeptidase
METIETPETIVANYLALQDVNLNKQVTEQAHVLLAEVAAFLKPGLAESEMGKMIDAHLAQSALVQYWHKPYVRFGQHTQLSYYNVVKNEDFILKPTDIAYLDIGPIIEGIEGDAGQTYVIGKNPEYEAIQACCQCLFTLGLNYWKACNPTGKVLYDYLTQEALKYGYVLDLDPAGHMIGTFPHKGWKKGINHFNYPLDAGIWILEIHLLSPCGQFGAFYENILI